jgi:1-aminocyclopropane-1-carboxylate deaminase/D-cysteine desulfhydrase-like pyridoxal-dependent ACC family enzyme
VAYASCLLEICGQLDKLEIRVDYLVTCSTAATQSGLALANKAIGAGLKIIGVAAGRRDYDIPEAMAGIAKNAADHLGLGIGLRAEEIHNTDDYVGESYGIVTKGGLEALRLMARTEGILLDPSYTGKALAGLVDMIGKGEIHREATVLFLHTGGTPALFAYAEELTQHLPT